MQAHFYDELKPMADLGGGPEDGSFVPAPRNWLVAVGDIRNSTGAVEEGRHSEVNFAAAALIAGLTNLCGSIPFQFGGDGAAALVPPDYETEARRELARTRGFARREMGLELRVGMTSLDRILGQGEELLVGRYEPSPGNAYAHFLGQGVERLELAIKGRDHAELAALAAIDEALDDGEWPDLTGLSCRWQPIRPKEGRMVALVVRAKDHRALHADLSRLAGLPALKATGTDDFEPKWPPRGFMLEARAMRGGRALLPVVLNLLAKTLIAYISFRFNLVMGSFDPRRYKREVLTNLIDFSRSGDILSIVFDCPAEKIAAIRAYLEERQVAGDLLYGMHVADFALMTCLVSSASQGLHVHFADGGDGGYTRAASQLKASLAAMAE